MRMDSFISISKYLIILLFGYTSLVAGDFDLKFERIGREQGLTDNTVLSILQDRHGFMWFGTMDGLFRFDGYGMTVYKYDPLDSTSLGNNNVFALLEDHTGTLWVGTAAGGLNRFDRKTEQFIRYKHIPDDPSSMSADVVSALFEDRNGDLWAGTWSGLNKIDLTTGEITPYINNPGDPASMSPHWIRSICEDSSGSIWVGTDGGISCLDRNSSKFTHFVEDPKDPYSLSSNGTTVIKDIMGTLWIGTWSGLDRFDDKTERFNNFPVGARVTSICEGRRGVLWIGTDRHLLFFDRMTGRFTEIVLDPAKPINSNSDAIQTIYEDRTGTLWIGTINGVYRYDRGQERFHHLVHDPNKVNGLSENRIRAICEDREGAVWIGTAGEGLNKYDSRTGQFQHSFPGLENEDSSADFAKNIPISSLFADRFGILWIGQWIGLGRFDPQQQQFRRFVHHPEDPQSLSGNNIQSIFEDKTGALWVGAYFDGPEGLNRFDRQQQQFTRFDLTPENISGLGKGSGRIQSISENKKSGKLWFATMGGGVCLFDPVSETFTRFTHDPGNPNSLSHGWIGVVHEDQEGTLWTAPWYGGLNKLAPESGHVTIYTEQHGLPSNYISSIIEDDNGHLWLTTKNGLSRFDRSSETFKNFDHDDGLLNTDFDYRNVSLKRKTGEVYFGGENGIDFVHPDSIRDNPHVPPVVFTGFIRYNSSEASGQAIVEKGITEKRHFDLSYQDHTLTFRFAALNYRAPHKNQYAYKLEGFQEEWIELGNRHEVTLTNLDPGNYTLRVKGSNNDGTWNEEGASLIINISPPWWRTGLAYTFYTLFLGLTLYGLRRFELRRAGLKNELERQHFEAEKLREVDQLKSRFFANISHEFRTPLTLITGPLDKLLSEDLPLSTKQQFQLMKRNAHRLKILINQLLDLSKVEAGKMKLAASFGDIVQLVRTMTLSFASMAERKNINLVFQSSPEQINAWFDRKKLDKIIANLLSNALKFTPEEGRVSVNLSVGSGHPNSKMPSADNCLLITVRDTGIGIPAERLQHIFDRFYQVDATYTREQEGSGIGLALVKEFVEMHQGKILVESIVGSGTLFTVALPLGCAHLSDEEIVKYTGDTSISSRITNGLDFEADADSSMDKAKTDKNNPTILITEDNADMRRYIYESLVETYNILEAENGEFGWQIATAEMPDLIISDVMMPRKDGFALCEKLKSDQRTSHIPVILLTARASGGSKIKGLETGADDYLIKPFDVRELKVRVSNLISQRQKLRERYQKEVILGSGQIKLSSTDEKFLKRITAIVQTNMTEIDFSIEDFAREACLSRVQLHRKLQALTGLSASRFIRVLRLKRAAELLKQQTGNVSEVAFAVGFNSLSHFNRSFREQYKKSPTEYLSNPE